MQERRTVAPVVTTDAGPDAPATPLWSANIAGVAVTDPPRRQRRVWSARVRLVVASAVATAVIGVDQVAKGLVLRHIGRGESIELMFGVRLVRAFNTGMSFSLGRGSESLKITVFVVALVLIWVARRELGRSVDDPRAPSVPGVTAFGLVIGGAVANLVDRAFRGGKGFGRGAVIDFVDVGWWPVFNVADAALVVGCVALLAGSVRDGREGSPAGGKLPNRVEASRDRAEEE